MSLDASTQEKLAQCVASLHLDYTAAINDRFGFSHEFELAPSDLFLPADYVAEMIGCRTSPDDLRDRVQKIPLNQPLAGFAGRLHEDVPDGYHEAFFMTIFCEYARDLNSLFGLRQPLPSEEVLFLPVSYLEGLVQRRIRKLWTVRSANI